MNMVKNNRFIIKTVTDFDLVVDYLLPASFKNNQSQMVLALEGDLGVGKTAFVKRLGKVLGVTENVNSPTFNILKTYNLPCPRFGFERLVHIDAYRLKDKAEIKPLKLNRLLTESGTIGCIEWPDILADFLPDNTINLKFKIIPGTEIRELLLTVPKV